MNGLSNLLFLFCLLFVGLSIVVWRIWGRRLGVPLFTVVMLVCGPFLLPGSEQPALYIMIPIVVNSFLFILEVSAADIQKHKLPMDQVSLRNDILRVLTPDKQMSRSELHAHIDVRSGRVFAEAHTLYRDGLLARSWRANQNGEKEPVYLITEMGRKALLSAPAPLPAIQIPVELVPRA